MSDMLWLTGISDFSLVGIIDPWMSLAGHTFPFCSCIGHSIFRLPSPFLLHILTAVLGLQWLWCIFSFLYHAPCVAQFLEYAIILS